MIRTLQPAFHRLRSLFAMRIPRVSCMAYWMARIRVAPLAALQPVRFSIDRMGSRETLPPGKKMLVTPATPRRTYALRSEEHTSELQSLAYLVCRLLLEKKKTTNK